MKILVLGGTGAMGRHLIHLLGHQYDVTVTSRRPHSSTGNIHYVTGNAHETPFLTSLLTTRWDAIVDFMVYSTEAFRQRHRLLLNATSQYVFLSSSRVYAESHTPLTEDSPRLLETSRDAAYLATDEYALSKARQENILFGLSQRNWTIIRPYITFDTFRLQLGILEKEQWLRRALSAKKIVIPPEIMEKETTMTHGLDVARAIQAILGQPKAYGEAFHVTAPRAFQWKEALSVYREAIESRLKTPLQIHWATLNGFISCSASPYQIIYDRLYDRSFSNAKISAFINTSTFRDPLATLRQCCLDFLDKPEFSRTNWTLEALLDKMSGERTSLKQIPGFEQKVRYFYFRNMHS